MLKLRSIRLFRSNTKINSAAAGARGARDGSQIEWEVRPGGMVVQKRASMAEDRKNTIQVRVATVSHSHDISINATSTFGEMKMVLSPVTGFKPREQRLLFRGRERDDGDHLHMVGVKDGDKVLLFEDPAIKERKLRSLMAVMKQTIKF